MAPRTEEAEAWFSAVYEAVREIPEGNVTSYGHIALLLGKRKRRRGNITLAAGYTNYRPAQCPRQVGVCLKHLPSEQSQPGDVYNNTTVPWQRVISAKGSISPRGPGEAARQAEALRAEGVETTNGSMGEFLVDFAVYGWFPAVLPSEEAESTDDMDESDGS